jgi:hypothetical protein
VGNSRVPQNEYLIWSQKDKHAKAYAVLSERSLETHREEPRLADAEHAPLCLDCHADNAPADRRGPQFQLSDGVGCEACHGGAEELARRPSRRRRPPDQPRRRDVPDRPAAGARRAKCLSCHLGDDKRFVTHRMMGAGHPPMPFELDTYTAIEPAHFVVDQSYVERKGRPNDMQIWAVGQAVDVKLRMDLILDPKNAPKGINFELSLFDCQSCHHSMSELQWRARASTGLPPGRIKLYDATAVMLRVVAERVAPDQAKALRLITCWRCTQATGESWDAVSRRRARCATRRTR